MASKYAHLHEKLNGPGDARPTALQIIQDENLNNKLQDKVFVITGCASGIGSETARAIATTGAKLYLPVRNPSKASENLSDILKPGHIELINMDQSKLSNVRTAAKEILEKSGGKVNVLINNAGIMAVPERTLSPDGFEAQFATNHLAHFLLFQLLKPALLSSSTPSFPSRVVNVSSSGHRAGGIRFEDYNFDEKDSYSPFSGYGQSKTANIYMANEIERRYGAKGLHATSLMPGGIWTGLQVHIPPEMMKRWDNPDARAYMKSTAQGAATTVWAAVAEEWKDKGGKYLEDCQVSKPNDAAKDTSLGYAAHAYDESGEKRLWVDSLKMVGLPDDE